MFWNCDMLSCDFSNADARGARTEPNSPTRAIGCRWAGIVAALDCKFFGGIEVGAGEAYDFATLGLVVKGPDRQSIYESIPKLHRHRSKSLLRQPFREEDYKC